MPALTVSVQAADFDVAVLQQQLLDSALQTGGVATFTGYVRGNSAGQQLQCMQLEHYPGMTERSIEAILTQAADRWPLLAVTVVHRIGSLQPGQRIVWVGVASAHREAAFSACEFVMDYLKNEAPFWKKEIGDRGAHWVEAHAHDKARADRWKGE
jgi:molybdopterin synthase catalytic subunit